MKTKTSQLYWFNVITILGLIIAAVIVIPFQETKLSK